MRHVKTLYLGWYSNRHNSWYTIGRFDCDENEYRFKYLAGAVRAQQEADFGGVAQFPDVEREYVSSNLFAFVGNRLLSKRRPEYDEQTRRLGLEPTDLHPFDILSRSYGRRATDTYELYPAPLRTDNGISLHFFSRGVRYLDEDLKKLWQNDEPAAPLQLQREPDNSHDPHAIEIFDHDARKLGYVPRYYTVSLSQLLQENCDYQLKLVRHNKEPGFVRQRFLLHLEAHVPDGWHFPQSSDYESVSSVIQPDTEAA